MLFYWNFYGSPFIHFRHMNTYISLSYVNTHMQLRGDVPVRNIYMNPIDASNVKENSIWAPRKMNE